MNTKSSQTNEGYSRGGTMRRNDSCNFLIHKNRWIKIYCLYQIEMVIIRQKYLLRGWGYHGSVRGDTINRYEGVSWIGIYTICCETNLIKAPVPFHFETIWPSKN